MVTDLLFISDQAFNRVPSPEASFIPVEHAHLHNSHVTIEAAAAGKLWNVAVVLSCHRILNPWGLLMQDNRTIQNFPTGLFVLSILLISHNMKGKVLLVPKYQHNS
jgi:hypothetical protein